MFPTHKQAPTKVVITTGTQYDRQDVLQAQQLLAGKQSPADAPIQQMTSPATNRIPQSQPTRAPSFGSPARTVASDGNRANQQSVSITQQRNPTGVSQVRQTVPQTSAPTVTTTVRTLSTPGSTVTKPSGTPNKQVRYQCQRSLVPLSISQIQCLICLCR